MLLLVGKSASGKSEILKRLKELGMKTIVTYTTRPPRIGEVEGIDYHFISEEDFIKKIQSDFFAETTKYETVNGIWRYGSAKEDYDNNTAVILNPEGLKSVKRIFPEAIAMYIIASNKTRYERAISRIKSNDKKGLKEIDRRFEADENDFTYIHKYVDGVFVNENVKTEEDFNRNVEFLLEMYEVLENKLFDGRKEKNGRKTNILSRRNG